MIHASIKYKENGEEIKQSKEQKKDNSFSFNKWY